MDDRPDPLDAPMDATEARSDAPTTYERDFYLWCFEQAELLRLRRFSEADLPNIVEELESMGRSERNAFESSFRLLISHLLKWQFQPQLRSSSWEITIVRERANISRRARENPTLAASMRDLPHTVYRDARREAEVETKLPRSSFPAECPYTLDEILQDDWLPA